jgi:hypothetical protein
VGNIIKVGPEEQAAATVKPLARREAERFFSVTSNDTLKKWGKIYGIESLVFWFW